MTIRVPVLFSLVSLVFGLTARGTEQPQDVPACEFVRRVVTHELKVEEQDQSNWLFRLDIENPNGQKEADEVVETKQGDLTRPILINGRELTAEERQKAEANFGVGATTCLSWPRIPILRSKLIAADDLVQGELQPDAGSHFLR